MLNRLRALLPSSKAVPDARVPLAAESDPALKDLYPPNDGTIPVFDPDLLLKHHHQAVEAVMQASGLEAPIAQRVIGDAISACAHRTLTLPATRDSFYAGKGGLFRLALDVALAAARKSQVTEFSGLGKIEQRRRETTAWRLACVLAGLCYDIHRVSSLYSVSSPAGDKWSPLRESLWEFTNKHDCRYVLLAWRSQGRAQAALGASPESALNTALVSQVVPNEALQFLLDGDPDILTQFYAVISGDAHAHASNKIRPLVENARARVIAADEATDPMRFGTRGVGTSLGPYFADGLRQLRETGRWTVNDERGRVWIAKEGVFLMWPVAAKEIRELLEAARLPGIPRDEHTIAELLRDSGIIEPRTTGRDAASVLWRIRLPGGREVSALKLGSPSTLFPDGDPPAIAADLAVLTASEQPRQMPPVAPQSLTLGKVPVELADASSAADPPPLPPPAAPPAANGIHEAIKTLDPAGQALMKEVVKAVANPKKLNGELRMREDGSLSLTCHWINDVYGMVSEPMARKLYTAGWLVGPKGKFIQKDTSGRDIIVFEPRIARLLVDKQGERDLLSAAAP